MEEIKVPQPPEGKEKLSKKILLADDEAGIRSVLERMFRGMGYEVESVESGQELLNRLVPGIYDLVFSDNNMPELKGIDALQKIRENEAFKNLPVIIYSSDAEFSDFRNKVKALNAFPLAKPAQLSEIRAVVEKAFAEPK